MLVGLLASMAAAQAAPASAQARATPPDSLRSYRHHGPCGGCCHCRRDNTTTTERTNRTALLMGLGVTSGQDGRAYASFDLEVGRAVGPRLTVGGRAWVALARNSASSYGYDATAPAIGLAGLVGTARYQLLNSRRWRLEALGGLGAGSVQLLDRDQTVVSYGKYGPSEHAATVFFSVHPLLEGGAGLTYKLKRDFWLSSRLTYRYLPGTGGLGGAGEFSGCQASVAAAVPWGWRARTR